MSFTSDSRACAACMISILTAALLSCGPEIANETIDDSTSDIGGQIPNDIGTLSNELLAERGIYITSPSAQTRRFSFHAGPSGALTKFEGDLVSAVNPTAFAKSGFEAEDVLKLTSVGHLYFLSNASNPSAYADAFDVTYASGEKVCVGVKNSSIAVYVGAEKKLVVPPFDLYTLGSCGGSSVSNWPAFSAVTPFSAPVASVFAAPGYRAFTIDPRSKVFNDGRILTEVARVSDAAAFGISGTNDFRHSYSKVSPWNADNSEALMFSSGATSATIIVDGRTFAFKRKAPTIRTGGRWSTINPKLYYQIPAGFPPQLATTDVTTGQSTIVRDFSAAGYVESAKTSLFGGEGNQSVGDRIWVMQMRHATRGLELVIWDQQQNAIRGRIPMPDQAGPGSNYVDNWGVSPKGTYVITNSIQSWSAGTVNIPRGYNVWSLEGAYVRSMPKYASHVDYCLDVNGKEVIAFIQSKYSSNDKTGQTWAIDGSMGNQTVDQFSEGTIGWNFHISCSSTSRPGYMVVSSFPKVKTSDYNTFPMWNHIFAVRLDGSKKVAVIANAHHSATGNAFKEYERSPFAVPNRDLSAVWFTASWDSIYNPVHSYVARPKLP